MLNVSTPPPATGANYIKEEPAFIFPDDNVPEDNVPEDNIPEDKVHEDNSKIHFIRIDSDEAITGKRRSYRSTSPIINSQTNTQNNRLKSRGCNGKRYCENSRRYPGRLINQIVKSESKIPNKIKNKLLQVKYYNFIIL